MLENVYVHAFLDGRDVAPTSAIDIIRGIRRIYEGNWSR